MRLLVRSRFLAKQGNTEAEYEDALWAPEGDAAHWPVRCAVADGATETSFSGVWARLLVEAYARNRLGSRLEGLPAVAARWQSQVGQVPLPWYAEEKLRQGAFAAFAGLSLVEQRGTLRWHALAVGDTCLVHLRAGAIQLAFPVSTAAAFSNHPALLSTVPQRNTGVAIGRRSGYALPGDQFLLMTDALACWFLTEHERGGCPAAALGNALTGDFAGWIAELRGAQTLRNDDVTVLCIDVEPALPAPAPH